MIALDTTAVVDLHNAARSSTKVRAKDMGNLVWFFQTEIKHVN